MNTEMGNKVLQMTGNNGNRRQNIVESHKGDDHVAVGKLPGNRHLRNYRLSNSVCRGISQQFRAVAVAHPAPRRTDNNNRQHHPRIVAFSPLDATDMPPPRLAMRLWLRSCTAWLPRRHQLREHHLSTCLGRHFLRLQGPEILGCQIGRAHV